MDTPAAMRQAAADLLAGLCGDVRDRVALRFDDDARRRLEYRPNPRAGAHLGEFSLPSRKHAHRLLATGLSPQAFAQAMAVLALEEVLDRDEGGQQGRHSNDYWLTVFGDPAGAGPWAWRFEGHHVSVSMTVRDDEVWATPLFLGANPAHTTHAGVTVLRPLAPEEDLGFALLGTLDPAGRTAAMVAPEAPPDIRSGTRADAGGVLEPRGISSGRLGPAARGLLGQLVGVYLARLPADLAAAEAARLDGAELHFAWEGRPYPGAGHYYRVQGPDLLIEFDNRDNDANHAHTVLRRPAADFGGGDVLAAHRAATHRPA